MRTQFAVVTGLVCAMCISAATQRYVEPEDYEVHEAYEVYNVLLPDEESYELAKSTLVIQQDTVAIERPFGSCLTGEAERKFKDAIADFARVNKKRWILQPKFELAKRYELVPEKTIRLSSKLRFSGFIVVFSAIGFNRTKTQAVVYTKSSCPGLCGTSAYRFLEMADGKWKTVFGWRCMTRSSLALSREYTHNRHFTTWPLSAAPTSASSPTVLAAPSAGG